MNRFPELNSQKLHREDWLVKPVAEHSEAAAFVREHHYSRSTANTSVYRFGLYEIWGDGLKGVALWMPPTKVAAQSVAGEAWQGVLCLSRLACSPACVSNAASFLLGQCMRMIDRKRWPVLLTYADTGHGHTGAIYKATNWREIGPVKAGDVWVDAEGRQCGRKRGPKTLTRAEMSALGLTCLHSNPKIKFVHEARKI